MTKGMVLTYEIVNFTSSGFTLTPTSTMSPDMLAGAKVYIKVYVEDNEILENAVAFSV